MLLEALNVRLLTKLDRLDKCVLELLFEHAVCFEFGNVLAYQDQVFDYVVLHVDTSLLEGKDLPHPLIVRTELFESCSVC